MFRVGVAWAGVAGRFPGWADVAGTLHSVCETACYGEWIVSLVFLYLYHDDD